MLHKLLVVYLFTISCTLISMEATCYLEKETNNRLKIPSGRSVEIENAIAAAKKRYGTNASEYTPYSDLAQGITPIVKGMQADLIRSCPNVSSVKESETDSTSIPEKK